MQGDSESAERSTASFMLQLGLRSFAGGNLEAALHRLGACEQQLRAMLPGATDRADTAEGATEAVDEQLSIQLGAVCGSLGDCHRRLGDTEKATQRYQDSVAQLQRSAVPSDEVRSRGIKCSVVLWTYCFDHNQQRGIARRCECPWPQVLDLHSSGC